ncbi:MAG TPA: TetR-like C-terminal domain-containing protein, partial [Streptosporangiaceae bacterium]|nr:TetR-like C-terminal domain-containing protein [Streptosporangiaceae bacterium]
EFSGPDDPLLAASTRVLDSIAAVLRGYGIGEDEMNHAIRTIRSTIHGFAMLDASRGFQWDADPDQSFDWMIRFIDRGLRDASPRSPGHAAGRHMTALSFRELCLRISVVDSGYAVDPVYWDTPDQPRSPDPPR